MNNKLRIVFKKLALIVSLLNNELVLASNEPSVKPISQTTALEFIHNSAVKISTHLGVKSQTRISFAPYTIKEIVGDSNKYKIIYDSLGSSIFILPKVKVGEKIEITIITNGGKAQDFSFKVKDTEGTVILVKEAYTSNKSVTDKLDEAKRMISRMSRGLKGKYFVTNLTGKSPIHHSCKDIKNKPNKGVPITCGGYFKMPKELSGLSIVETNIYNYRLANITGIILEITNNTKKPIIISEVNLTNIFKNTLLASVETKMLEPKNFTRGFVILDLEEEK